MASHMLKGLESKCIEAGIDSRSATLMSPLLRPHQLKSISARLGAESPLGSQHSETAPAHPLVSPQLVQAAVKTQIVKTVTQKVEELDDGEQESTA